MQNVSRVSFSQNKINASLNVLQEKEGTGSEAGDTFVSSSVLSPLGKPFTCKYNKHSVGNGLGSIHNRAKFSYITSQSHIYSEMNSAYPCNIIIF